MLVVLKCVLSETLLFNVLIMFLYTEKKVFEKLLYF